MTSEGKTKNPDHGGSAPTKLAQEGNHLQKIAIFVSVLLALFSVVMGQGAERKADKAQEGTARVEETVRLSRVETGKLAVNLFGKTPDDAWRPWIDRLSPVTTYVGVQREVRFPNKFDHPPSVATAFNVIAMYGLKELFLPREIALFSDRTRGHLTDIHVVTFCGNNPSESGFEMQLGIGLPSEAAQVLVTKLAQAKPDMALINEQRKIMNLPQVATLDENQTWVANFQQFVGALDVIWIAQAQENANRSTTGQK